MENLDFLQIARSLPHLYGIAYNLLKNQSDAEDAVQETICKFLQKRPTLEIPGKLPWYLGKMVANHCMDLLRRKGRQISLDEIPESSGKEEETSKNDDFQKERDIQLASWLSRLPPKDRLVLDLFYREELDLQEIAEILGDTAGAVKVRLHRARGALRKMASREGV